jgi:hypothetical protein
VRIVREGTFAKSENPKRDNVRQTTTVPLLPTSAFSRAKQEVARLPLFDPTNSDLLTRRGCRCRRTIARLGLRKEFVTALQRKTIAVNEAEGASSKSR